MKAAHREISLTVKLHIRYFKIFASLSWVGIIPDLAERPIIVLLIYIICSRAEKGTFHFYSDSQALTARLQSFTNLIT